METIRASGDVSVSTVYHWLKTFVMESWKSLAYEKMPGRPSPPEQNAKAPTAGLAQSGTGKVWRTRARRCGEQKLV